ncbi:hypothetical protein CEXT_58691 [Caerostris extrusa]|uniref:Uncharacterized protein n=1 Tax=Caerostris extrusa TaxID=172846 RepID=A0AAV4MEI2_CAEEX|nr:hypothetical protein CEXT_58691 [Caerostris extrusa]
MQMSKLDEREICYIVVTYLSWSTVEEDKITRKHRFKDSWLQSRKSDFVQEERKEESLPGSLQGEPTSLPEV